MLFNFFFWTETLVLAKIAETFKKNINKEQRNNKQIFSLTPFLDGGNKTFAKLVDLDPEAQLFSEIWGWRIRVGNLFSADYTPVPFQYIWKKMVTRRRGDSTLGAAYQSVLSKIRWIDTSNDSPFIRQIQTSMNNDNIDGERLSIRFNVDMYQRDYRKDNFTIGRVTGKIYR